MDPEIRPLDEFGITGRRYRRRRRQPRAFIPTERDRNFVRLLAATGIPHLVICRAVGLQRDCFETTFRKELDEGAVELLAMAVITARSLLQNADDATRWKVAEFILRTTGRMDPMAVRSRTDTSAPRELPPPANIEISAEEAAVIGRLLERKAATTSG
ncbi:MAG: hypothetical protein NZM12_01170 [Steroidobacteraceae bacterium]|nr:hypothetical protein [Steroidobacteraceae bacterium]MDW8258761.1 hypothetical protein [Gammaproteobacteria bacterium]